MTSDLDSYDLTGARTLDNDSDRNVFRTGPVFSNLLGVADITRATPKVQQALAEVMAERNLTLGGIVRPLPHPFMTIATRYPDAPELPEVNLDRFLFQLTTPPLEREAELAVLGGSGPNEV